MRALAWELMGTRLAAGLAVVGAVALPLAGCGNKDFPNDPRPPALFETTASIGPNEVSVEPKRFGAGVTVITIANLSSSPASFQLKGPTEAHTQPIDPGAVTSLQAELKQGHYQVSAAGASGIKAGSVEVGPQRKSAQNTLLLP